MGSRRMRIGNEPGETAWRDAPRGSSPRAALVLLLSLMAATALPGQTVFSTTKVTGTLAFDGHGTLGAFTGKTAVTAGALVGGPGLDSTRGWVEGAAGALVTGNGKRDHDMYGSLEVKKFPLLRFDLDSVTAGTAEGDSIPVTLHGRFTLHGQVRPASVHGWIWPGASSTRFRGATPLNVKDYGIGGLTKFLGVLKMNPEIVVRMEVQFARSD